MDIEYSKKYLHELCTSSPIEFEGIKLFPVLFKDVDEYNVFVSCLLFNPLYYNDIKISSLPRLYFITSLLLEDSDDLDPFRRILLAELCGLLKLVLHDQTFEFIKNPNGQVKLCVYTDSNKEKKVLINAKKFEEMRRIILLQNDTYYDDSYIHPDILRWIEDQKALENKRVSNKIVSTKEDKIESLMIIMNQTDEHFLDQLTIRRVNRLFEKSMDKQIFEAQMIGTMSGLVKFKEPPTSWTVTKQKQNDFDKYLQELHPVNK